MDTHEKHAPISFFTSRLTCIVSIALALFLSGLVLLTLLMGNELSSFVKENLTFSIVLQNDISQAEIQVMQKNLSKQPYIKSTRYISKEQALDELIQELGENPETFLGHNPLSASIEVNLHAAYTHPDSLVRIEKEVKASSTVSDLLYRRDMMEAVHTHVTRLGLILAAFAMILLIISFVLVNNTIRLFIYSKRFLIHTMRLVGATGNFIRRPFLWYNIVNGIVAAILSLSFLSVALYYMQAEWEGFMEILNVRILVSVAVVILSLSILLSAVATFFAVNRYLRMNVDRMFYL
jgi:cell division transport system permease protein